jgi:hypothetical protein
VSVRALAASAPVLAVFTPSAAAQFTDPPSRCPSGSRVGYAMSDRSTQATWGVNSGLRFYTIRWSASMEKCGGRSRIVYHLYWDLSSFPRNRYVLYQFQAQRTDGSWRAACVRQYGSDERRCVFRLDGGTRGPRFGAAPIVQFRNTRGRSFISHARLLASPFQDDTGTAPAGRQYDKTLRLDQGRKP